MRQSRRIERRAFTLIEIMLVVMIVLILTALAVPVIRSMLIDSRATAAGDMIRGQLAETRARAMEEGRPWRFAYMPGTGVFQLAPEDSKEWDQPAQNPVETKELLRDVLPTDVVFGAAMEDILGGGNAAGSGNWETIAIYLPAGDTRADTVVYFGQTGYLPRSAVVRGLTGAVSIEDPIPGATP